MKIQTNKNFIIKKTAQLSIFGFISRVLGIIREVMQGQLLGVGEASDGFLTAFGVPNLFRKIFESGGITSALVPHLVKIIHGGDKRRASELISAVLFVFDALLMVCCLGVLIFPTFVTYLVAPGFSPDQVAATVPLLKIMFPVIIFLATCNIVSGGLHAINHFFVPAFGPVIFNIVYLAGLFACLKFNLSVSVMAWVVVLAGFAKMLSSSVAFWWNGFSFVLPTRACLSDLCIVARRFIPCLISVGALEISMFFDKRLASYLPKGSVTLLYYAQRFSMLPYSMLAVALATVLLAHFSLAALKNAKRLPFFLLESSKLATWFSLPLMCVMMFVAKSLFADVMLKGRATPADMSTAALLLGMLLCALPFQVLNKIMVSVFYAKNDTMSPMYIVMGTTAFSTLFNYMFIGHLGIYVMAIGLLLATCLKTVVLGVVLAYKHAIQWPLWKFLVFLKNLILQLFIGVCIFNFLYATLCQLVAGGAFSVFFSEGASGYWILVLGSLCITLGILWITHRRFGIKLYLVPHYGD